MCPPRQGHCRPRVSRTGTPQRCRRDRSSCGIQRPARALASQGRARSRGHAPWPPRVQSVHPEPCGAPRGTLSARRGRHPARSAEGPSCRRPRSDAVDTHCRVGTVAESRRHRALPIPEVVGGCKRRRVSREDIELATCSVPFSRVSLSVKCQSTDLEVPAETRPCGPRGGQRKAPRFLLGLLVWVLGLHLPKPQTVCRSPWLTRWGQGCPALLGAGAQLRPTSGCS